MIKGKRAVVALLIGLFLAGCTHNVLPGGKTPRMTKEELRPLLGSPDVVVIDVRLDREWDKATSKVKGAVREDPEKDVRTWMNRYPKNKILVFYCS